MGQLIINFEGNAEDRFEEIEQRIMDLKISSESDSFKTSSSTSYFPTKYQDIESFVTISLLNEIFV